MTRENIINNIQEILISVMDTDEFIMSLDLKSGDIEGWNSLTHAILITALEERFNIKFKIIDLHSWSDINSLVNIIENKSK